MSEQETSSNTEQLATPLDFEDVTIGVLTALEEEYIACKEVFDPNHMGEEKQKRATSGELRCWLCTVPSKFGGNHVVAITMLLDMGNTAAAIAANILLQHCPAIDHLIMCGIAGAVPNTREWDVHVRLGDIVVSDDSGIIQYDRGKQRDPRRSCVGASAESSLVTIFNDPFAGFDFRGAHRPPSPTLLNAVKHMHAEELLLERSELRPWECKVANFLRSCKTRDAWERPHEAKDRLIDTPDGKGPCTSHPVDDVRRRGYPRVFGGPIAAANVVQSDPKRRDALRDQYKIRAVEMEGSGVADAAWVAGVGYLVVRGTCDYCNSTKNDDYHQYAALIAAAYTCTVIEYLHVNVPTTAPSIALTPKTAAAVTTQERGGTPRFDGVVSPPRGTVIRGRPASTHPILEATDFGSSTPPAEAPPSVNATALEERVTRLRALREDFCTPEIDVTAQELERQLRLLPRRGSLIREGWTLLAKIESERLLAKRHAGQAIDVTRLRELRQEAENVVD